MSELNSLWKIWTLFNPRLALVGLAGFLTVLALFIHAILLATPEFSWLHTGSSAAVLSYLPPVVK